MSIIRVWLGILVMVSVGSGISLAKSQDRPINQPSAKPEKRASEERGSLTVEEVIRLKKAGISDATIQLLIEDKELPRRMKEQAFAQDHMGTWNIKDSQGKEAIIYSTAKGREEDYYDEREYWRALELLRAMWPQPVVRLGQEPPASE